MLTSRPDNLGIGQIVISLLALFALNSPVNAKDSDLVFMSKTNGVHLAQMCDEAQSFPVRFDPCNSYIVAAVDAFQLTKKLCIPQEMLEPAIITEMVRKYVKEHPEEWHKHATFLIYDALSSRSSCR